MEGHIKRTDTAGPHALAEHKSLLVSLFGGLVLVAVLGKASLLPFPVSTAGELVRWMLRLAIVVSADVCFLAAFMACCAGVSTCVSRWPRVFSVWRPVCRGLCMLMGVYFVGSIPLFKVTMTPFSVRFLELAGGPDMMLSSVTVFLTPGLIAALSGVMLVLVLAPPVIRRLLFVHGGRWLSPRTAVLAACILAAYGGICQTYIHARWSDPNRWERRIAQNPQTVLLASLVTELTQGDPLSESALGSAPDESDFSFPPASPVAPSGEPGAIKNVFFFVMESVGAEYVSTCGSRFPSMPNLDRLAARQGVVFENFYIHAPHSSKSLFSLASGVYPRPDHRLIMRDNLDFRVPTLAEVLEDDGTRSLFIHSGFWGWKDRDKYFKRGGACEMADAETLPPDYVNSWGVSDRTMLRSALEWIDKRPADPFFVFAFTIETHHPYHVAGEPVAFDTDDAELNRYLNAIRGADANLQWLVDELGRRGLADSTLIVVTADHGESFGQHGQRVHGFGTFQPNITVPLVMLHPSLAPRARRISQVRQQVDVAPTVANLLGKAPHADWQGRDMFRPEEERAYFFSLGHQVVLGVRDGPFKYQFYVDTGYEELFDLSVDPKESDNVADQHPEVCQSCRRRAAGFIQYHRRYLKAHGAD
jgi:hypothetical protein